MGGSLTPGELDEIAKTRPALGAIGGRRYADVAARMPRMRGAVRDWFVAALEHPAKKWVAAAMLAAHPTSAKTLVRELLRAGLREENPSFNRAFAMPLRGHCTYDEAVMLALPMIETEGEAGGLARLEYWLGVELGPGSPEVRRTMNRWRMETFLCVEDGYAKRSLLAGMAFAPEELDDEAARLAPKVIQEARTSDDDYLRQRLRLQLGERVPIPALLRG